MKLLTANSLNGCNLPVSSGLRKTPTALHVQANGAIERADLETASVGWHTMLPMAVTFPLWCMATLRPRFLGLDVERPDNPPPEPDCRDRHKVEPGGFALPVDGSPEAQQLPPHRGVRLEG